MYRHAGADGRTAPFARAFEPPNQRARMKHVCRFEDFETPRTERPGRVTYFSFATVRGFTGGFACWARTHGYNGRKAE
jgi:hypothetical protein